MNARMLFAVSPCDGEAKIFSEKNPAHHVPPEYRRTYNKLKEILDDFDSLLSIQDKMPDYPVIFGAQLLTAHCNRGAALLRPQAVTGVIAYLDALKKLGVGGVTFAIHYPLYTPDFPDYHGYVAFYKRVAKEVRKRGLKMEIESHIVFANTSFSYLKINYAGLTFERYKREAKQMFQNIINHLEPDYLNIIAEPDTQATLTGLQEFNDPEKCVEFVQYVLDGLKKGKTKIVAGIGSWGNIELARGFAAHTNVDCISIHAYPIIGKSIENIFLILDIAHQYHKGLVMDEAWLHKSEKYLGNGDAAWTELFGRDVFSFWAPLDEQFLSCMVKLAKLQGIEYLSPFWVDYFIAYINYNTDNAGLSYKNLTTLHHKKEVTNLLADTFTSTGLFYKKLIEEYR